MERSKRLEENGGRMKNKIILFAICYLLFAIFLFGCVGLQRKELTKERPPLETATS
jgi:hypothetical protein